MFSIMCQVENVKY